MIGDSESDVEAASAAGACAIRLGPEGTKSAAGRVYPDLSSAVRGPSSIGWTNDRESAAVLSRATALGFGKVNSRFHLIRTRSSRGTLNSAPNGMC